MKIYGPYTRKDFRQHVIIIHDDGRRQTKSYPKFLLEKKLGRELTEDETCDHEDDDFTNNDPSNLQVLSRINNSKKGVEYTRGTQMYSFRCPGCEQISEKPLRDVNSNRNKGRAGLYCSRQCAGRANALIGHQKGS